MVKKLSILSTLYFLLSTLSLCAAIPVRWTVDTFRVKPLVYDCYHGETLDLAAAMTAYGDPLDLHGKTASLYWQTNGMDAAYWSTNATVSSVSSVTNVLSATFVGSFDPGAPSVSGFIGVEGENYRAAFQLNFRASPGFTPAHISPPVKVLDFATTTVANPDASPFMVKGGSGGVTAQQATNIASAVVAPIASTQSVHSATLSSHTSQLSQLSKDMPTKTSDLANDSGFIETFEVSEGWRGVITNVSFVASANAMNGFKVYGSDFEVQEGDFIIHDGWTSLMAIGEDYQTQTLPDYLASTAWHGSNKSLSDYGITNVAASVDYSAVTSIVESASVTNGGAKAYADANFLKLEYVPGFEGGKGYDSANFAMFYKDISDEITNYFVISTIVDPGITWFANSVLGFSEVKISVSRDDGFTFSTNDDVEGDAVESNLTPDNSPVATSNMVERVVASKPAPSPLTGKTYDFANGSNFTKTLYTALTNVIQTLGGTVTNPPTFN